MSERWARAALQAYRWAGVAAYPFIGVYVGLRATRGKEQHGRRSERYGRTKLVRPAGPLVWVHAVSVGETGAVFELVKRLVEQRVNVILTTGTVTSAKLARERLGDMVIHQFVPLDLKPAVSRFLAHWKPDLAIFAESEVWPMTILELGARRIPQVLINGRMSDRSFRRWQKRIAVAESLFEHFSHVAAQTDKDAERFRALGARPVTVTGNLKADVPLPPLSADHDEAQRRLSGRPVWAAVSTHDGEEDIAIRTHMILKRRWPGLLTVIVPRHPNRADDIRKLCAERGAKVASRTEHMLPGADTDIFLGDTIGEMGLYLRMTSIAFVGRSLGGEGGQNPLEPAVLGCAVLSGPNVSNFSEVYERLTAAHAARIVSDDKMLAKAVNYLLANPKTGAAMAAAANRTVQQLGGALGRTLDVLEPFIHPLVVEASLTAERPRDHDSAQTDAQRGQAGGW